MRLLKLNKRFTRKLKVPYGIASQLIFALVAIGSYTANAAESGWTLNPHATEYLSDEELPPRTKPLVELGPKFLSTGNISKGFVIPTGAVWTPSLWVYGNIRSAVQTYDIGADDDDAVVEEWANRLDLFANIQLSGTERILIGFTPFHDRDTGQFSGMVFNDDEDESINQLNLELDTLFFEGDLAELFPKWDYLDSSKNDIGFTVGRQNVLFSDGFIINDNMDGFGFSKNNIRFESNPNIINWRSSLFVGLSGVNRNDNVEDEDSRLYAWFNQIDGVSTTYNVDIAYVTGEESGDLVNLSLDGTRRIGKTNATFRAAFSSALDDITLQSDDGVLLFGELSWIPKNTHNNLYLNGFIGIDNFTSVARGPLNGGPLGRTGLLFASQQIGSYPSALSNSAQEAAGLALGYQMFAKDKRTQFTLEAAGRFENRDELSDEFGVAVRLQKALGYRSFWQLDGFVTDGQQSDTDYGVRLELQVKL